MRLYLRIYAFQREEAFNRKDAPECVESRGFEVLVGHDFTAPHLTDVAEAVPQGFNRILELEEITLNESIAALRLLGRPFAPIRKR